jgi:hypothetical protein
VEPVKFVASEVGAVVLLPLSAYLLEPIEESPKIEGVLRQDLSVIFAT